MLPLQFYTSYLSSRPYATLAVTETYNKLFILQVYFDMNYTNRTEFLEEHKRVLESRLQPVMREITGNILNMTLTVWVQ